MRSGLLVMFAVASLAAAASADDAEDRLRAAVVKLADDDPAVRAEGRELLGGLAEERPDLVRPVTENADPEIAATACEIIFERCILKEQVEQGRFGEILAAIADPRREPGARKALLRRFLDLGPKAAGSLADELKESATKSMTEPVLLAPGQRRDIVLRVRNKGKNALWYAPERYVVLGTRPEPLGAGHGSGGKMLVAVGYSDPKLQEDRVLSCLSVLRRVPPDGDITLGTVTVEADRCAVFRISIGVTRGTIMQATFHGVSIPASPAPLTDLPNMVILLLAPRESPNCKSVLLPKGPGGRPAITVTALKDFQPYCPGFGDNFWWAATDAEGRYLGSGPMREPQAAIMPWKESESATVEMPCDLPGGTRKLWMGFDASSQGDQTVPPPLEVPEPDPEQK